MITTVGIYVKQREDMDVPYHAGFLSGIRHILINANRQELGDLVECGQIGDVMLGFLPARVVEKKIEKPPRYFQDCDCGIQIGPQVPEEFVQQLINTIESAGYLTRLNPPTATPSPTARPLATARGN